MWVFSKFQNPVLCMARPFKVGRLHLLHPTSLEIYLLYSKRDKRVTEIDWNLYDMQYFPQHVLLCTSTVHDQSANICTQGYFRILWIRNTKSSKIDWIHKCYVSCLKLGYFFFVKLNPLMGNICNKWPWDGTLKIYRKNVACRAGS